MSDKRYKDFIKYPWKVKANVYRGHGEPLGFAIITKDAYYLEKYKDKFLWDTAICTVSDKEIAELIVSAVNEKLKLK